MPDEWRNIARWPAQDPATGRVVSDYIAGMTDRFALIEHKRLFGLDTDPSDPNGPSSQVFSNPPHPEEALLPRLEGRTTVHKAQFPRPQRSSS